jgi:hypothetical protein
MSEIPLPMGRLEAFEIGSKKLTIQTEFFPRPNPRIETKVYLGGALKKVYTDETGEPDSALQRRLDGFHEEKVREIVEAMRKRAEEKS